LAEKESRHFGARVSVAVQFIATNSVGAVSNREKIGSL